MRSALAPRLHSLRVCRSLGFLVLYMLHLACRPSVVVPSTVHTIVMHSKPSSGTYHFSLYSAGGLRAFACAAVCHINPCPSLERSSYYSIPAKAGTKQLRTVSACLRLFLQMLTTGTATLAGLLLANWRIYLSSLTAIHSVCLDPPLTTLLQEKACDCAAAAALCLKLDSCARPFFQGKATTAAPACFAKCLIVSLMLQGASGLVHVIDWSCGPMSNREALIISPLSFSTASNIKSFDFESSLSFGHELSKSKSVLALRMAYCIQEWPIVFRSGIHH